MINLLCKLDLFADQKLGLRTGITLLDVPTELRNQVRVQWYQHPEVMDEYIQSNPDGQSRSNRPARPSASTGLPFRPS